ncbi:Glycosylphosphatidylinositol anchor attachment 1 protein [Nymphon striatum]|nr:Glycosylphosphatidylinositol anchor attachment 1 protein [Nymphon striatum]
MGLLTDPSDKDKPAKFILQHHNKLSLLSYIAGLTWFALLAYKPLNAGTYFSENALLPGLVAREYQHGWSFNQFLKSLHEESEQNGNNAPFSWLLAKFSQLGLDVHIQNFTLYHPFSNKERLQGKNLYVILRAPRAASTEALVLSTTYRPNVKEKSNNPSIALMYSLANFFLDHTYWAKDIIFLITEHDQIGFQAWLDAYHHTDISNSVLRSSILPARSGSIQAAINLEIHTDKAVGLNIDIEGLNGQLPNLDLVNLVVELCKRESIHVTLQNRIVKSYISDDEWFDSWKSSMNTLLLMVMKQASGRPSSGHGLFHRYAIQSLTIETNDRPSQKYSSISYNTVGRVIEGVFRSLNNLLEKFHQSFFFYLLPSIHRYISIGILLNPISEKSHCTICQMWMPLFNILQATALWLQSGKCANKKKKLLESTKSDDENGIDYTLSGVIPIYFFVHCLGVALTMAPSKLHEVGTTWNFPYEDAISYGMVSVFCSFLVFPLFMQRRIKGYRSWRVLKCVTLLELGTIMFALAMMNFSFGLVLAVTYTPICYVISPSNSRVIRVIKGTLLLLISPLIFLYLMIVLHTVFTGYNVNMNSNTLLFQSLYTEKKLLIQAVEDSYIYGNWMYRFICCFICPTWLLLWSLLFDKSPSLSYELDEDEHDHQD